jgi:hypothetical protein
MTGGSDMPAGRLLHASSFVVLVGLAFLGPAPCAQAQHRHLLASLYEIREAHAEVKKVPHDFGGHKEKALLALDAAAIQIEKALRAVDVEIKHTPPEPKFYDRYENHRHLRHALVEIKEAEIELREAKHDFKGHREKALRDLRHAHEQVELLIKHIK